MLCALAAVGAGCASQQPDTTQGITTPTPTQAPPPVAGATVTRAAGLAVFMAFTYQSLPSGGHGLLRVVSLGPNADTPATAVVNWQVAQVTPQGIVSGTVAAANGLITSTGSTRVHGLGGSHTYAPPLWWNIGATNSD